jgi:NSS family neurotransmitter:Na+ symporter
MSNSSSSETTWKSQAGFVWSLIGSAVGFANILSFSAQVYKNGGGAFLIPYFFALFLLGIPLLILEGVVGHRLKQPLVTAYGTVWGQAGKMMGWMAVLACLTIGGFYIVLTGYSVAYTYFAANGSFPHDTKEFFLNSFLQITPSIHEWGHLSIPIFLSTIVVGAAAWLVLVRNVRDGIEKICSIFMPLLAVIMTSFAVIVTFLPGGIDGWAYYLRPDFSTLLSPALWRDVFGQLFFSLSLGLGIIVGYSRHTGEKTNIAKAMLYVALGDFAVSFIAGAAIFGSLAHIAHTQQIPFDSILTSDSTFEIGFVVFPHLFNLFGPVLGKIIGVTFFFCIFIAGITGVFSIVESIAGNIEVELKTSRKNAVTATIAGILTLALLFCMGNASHVIDALAPMVLGINMLIGGISLVMAFHYWCKDIRQDVVHTSSSIRICLRYFAPAILGIILIGNVLQEFDAFDIFKSVRWGWFALALFISWTLSQWKLAERAEKLELASKEA